jgi:hypothetical protein
LAAAALWSGSRKTIPATQTPTGEKDAEKGGLSHKHRLVALWHQLAGSFTIVAFFALGCALGVSHWLPPLPAEAGFYALSTEELLQMRMDALKAEKESEFM